MWRAEGWGLMRESFEEESSHTEEGEEVEEERPVDGMRHPWNKGGNL